MTSRPIAKRGIIKSVRSSPLVLLAGLYCLIPWSTANPASSTDVRFNKEKSSTPLIVLNEIRVTEADDQVEITLKGIPSLRYLSFKAVDPLRLVIVLPDIIGDTLQTPLVVENNIIGRIETSMPANNPFPLTRVEIGLKLNVIYEIRSVPGGIRIRLEKSAPETLETSNHADDHEKAGTAKRQQKMTSEKTAAIRQTEETTAPPAEMDKENNLPPASKIIAIQPIIHDEETTIQIIADGSLANYNTFHLTNPDRFVIDLMGVRSSEVKSKLSLKADMIRMIRIGYHIDKMRVVFDLVPETYLTYGVVSDNNLLLVSFKVASNYPEIGNHVR